MIQWVDAHCHLGFLSDEKAGFFAQKARESDTFLYSVTVEPAEYLRCTQVLSSWNNVAIGLGLHPWWVRAEDERVLEVVERIDQTRFVGEVGLDFGPAHVQTADSQVETFTSIARACARQGQKVLSLHSVAATPTVLDILEQTGCLDSCTCIFHWFSGSSSDLARARKAGCYFSVGSRMLGTRKGAQYVKEIPLTRLLVETDLPSSDKDAAWSVMAETLREAYGQIDAIRGEPVKERILLNSKLLFD